MQSVGRYDVVCYIDTNILQLFLYKRFFQLAPKVIEFELVPLIRVDRVDKATDLPAGM